MRSRSSRQCRQKGLEGVRRRSVGAVHVSVLEPQTEPDSLYKGEGPNTGKTDALSGFVRFSQNALDPSDRHTPTGTLVPTDADAQRSEWSREGGHSRRVPSNRTPPGRRALGGVGYCSVRISLRKRLVGEVGDSRPRTRSTGGVAPFAYPGRSSNDRSLRVQGDGAGARSRRESCIGRLQISVLRTGTNRPDPPTSIEGTNRVRPHKRTGLPRTLSSPQGS